MDEVAKVITDDNTCVADEFLKEPLHISNFIYLIDLNLLSAVNMVVHHGYLKILDRIGSSYILRYTKVSYSIPMLRMFETEKFQLVSEIPATW